MRQEWDLLQKGWCQHSHKSYSSKAMRRSGQPDASCMAELGQFLSDKKWSPAPYEGLFCTVSQASVSQSWDDCSLSESTLNKSLGPFTPMHLSAMSRLFEEKELNASRLSLLSGDERLQPSAVWGEEIFLHLSILQVLFPHKLLLQSQRKLKLFRNEKDI